MTDQEKIRQLAEQLQQRGKLLESIFPNGDRWYIEESAESSDDPTYELITNNSVVLAALSGIAAEEVFYRTAKLGFCNDFFGGGGWLFEAEGEQAGPFASYAEALIAALRQISAEEALKQ